jgi:superfamily II DNA or RNA helicase
MFARLRETTVVPYDLVIFDEAHKLAADRGNDLRVRRTDRYCLAEAIVGVQSQNPHWRLGWSAHHLLLLTATPHMGKDYPYSDISTWISLPTGRRVLRTTFRSHTGS